MDNRNHENSAPVSVAQEVSTANMSENITNKTRREQKFPPNTHLYMQGRLVNIYLNWHGRTNLIVIPHQRAFKLTNFYPIDLGYIFQEIYAVMEQKRVNNFSLHIFKRDWEVAPHLFVKIGMSQDQYKQFTSGPHISQSFSTEQNNQPRIRTHAETE